jgi:L-ascorbate metabolism protein UlaG (beta-lactamase superfamily)
MQQAMFGKMPSGKRLEEIKKSPNYRGGAFQNQSNTPSFTNGANLFSVLFDFVFAKQTRVAPKDKVPSSKTNLMKLPKDLDVLVWFGHSSYFMQVDGKRFLVDPGLSGSASPMPGGTKAFPGSDIYTADDIPEIDFLFISHDHWDHLDYKTIVKLKPLIKKVVCGLGTGAHLEHWGYPSEKILERDWNAEIDIGDGFKVFTTPARHFSGRTFVRNKALWMSYVLKTPTMQIFIGGDSGYDHHFAEIGSRFGGFDLAVLENGQYNKSWQHIHTLPNELLKVAKELKAKRILPVHSSKFKLSSHPWDEPLRMAVENGKKENIPVVTPMIGETVELKNLDQRFSEWWLGLI